MIGIILKIQEDTLIVLYYLRKGIFGRKAKYKDKGWCLKDLISDIDDKRIVSMMVVYIEKIDSYHKIWKFE